MSDAKPTLETLQELMIRLDGATREEVDQTAMKYGSLPTRLAMLGLASIRKGNSSLWWGYPPGVFISYKWAGDEMHKYAKELAEYIRGLGYRAYLDIENLDAEADAYFQIPEFITSMQYCTFYLLLLTEQAADFIFARKGKTTWIHEEYQHAVRMTNAGRLIMVPVLAEEGDFTEVFPKSATLDLTNGTDDFPKLKGILTPEPLTLNQTDLSELERVAGAFDKSFLNQKWEASLDLLTGTPHLSHTFDHQFRVFLHAIYTGNRAAFETISDQMLSIYGDKITAHMYKGFCDLHGIPNRMG